jgi:hypothetical protein
MNQQTNDELNNSQSLIEDLPVAQDRAADVKGGPLEIRELSIRVNVRSEE